MYEHKTFEKILGDLLSVINTNYPEIDTRVGSVIYTALAPIALELETTYREMDAVVDETFLATASKEYLIKHGDQLGLTLNEATYGHFVGEFDVDVEIGSRFNLEQFNYAVIQKLSNPTDENQYYTFELVCETIGSEPNGYLGELTPITFVNNLSYAKLTSVITYGEDEEETEAFRYRLQTHVKKAPVNGNVYQYDEWLNAYDGIGKYKISPCWNGVNTIKLTVLDSENRVANAELLDRVQRHFDPPTSEINDSVEDSSYPQGRGMGNGQAPIGAIVTVDTATKADIVIQCELKLKDGYTTPVGVEDAVEDYLNSIVFEKSTVAYMPISAAIYNAESVDEVLRLTVLVKGVEMDASATPFVSSISLSDNEIPVLDKESSVWGV